MSLAQQLAEIGVMLPMFGVGMHFPIADLLAVRKVAVPGAVVQMAVATAMGAGLACSWGRTLAASLVFGIALSVASTVVLLRVLEARNTLETPNRRIAVGWLVVGRRALDGLPAAAAVGPRNGSGSLDALAGALSRAGGALKRRRFEPGW